MDPQKNQGQQGGGNPQGNQPTPPPQQTPPQQVPPQPTPPPQGAGQGQGVPQGAYPPPGAYPQGYPQYPQGYSQYPQDPSMYPPGAYPYYPPQGGYPQGPYPPQGMQGQGMPPMPPEDTTPADFQLGAKLPAKLTVKIPKHPLTFDEDYFLKLLAGSISLSKDEKKRIIESVPKLKQTQIDELIRIFEEEKQKFAALSKKHVSQLEKLAEQHFREWMDLEQEFHQDSKKKEDQNKAEDIRKKLGI